MKKTNKISTFSNNYDPKNEGFTYINHQITKKLIERYKTNGGISDLAASSNIQNQKRVA